MIDTGLTLVTVLVLVAVSLVAEAQPAGPVRTIGIIGHVRPSSFEEGLRELGWVEGYILSPRALSAVSAAPEHEAQ